MTPDPDRLLDFARRYTAAWCSQNPASVAEHYARAGSLTINDGTFGRASRDHGGSAVIHDRVPGQRVLMDDLLVQDGGVEYHWTLIGTNTGPGGTGNRVRIPGSRSGRSVATDSSRSRKATSTRPSTTASSNMVWRNLDRRRTSRPDLGYGRGSCLS